jgi:4-hydroxy-tetrahydrodipicolinate synthase/2-dehydro-3-deoxy-phosphogluconate/2-dehydro-3-deoxy-6-phosphogalactonate aldolase
VSESPPTDAGGVRGVVPPTVTCYDETGGVDAAATAAHAEFVVDRGVHGVFPLGTNGEAPLVGPTERATVVEAVVDAVGDEVPVIAGVGVESTRETVRHATRAVEAGADGLVVVTPYYVPVDPAGVVAHYRRVAAAVDRPVYVYHIPSRTGTDLSLDTLDEVLALDGVVGVKDSGKRVSWLGQALARNPDATFLAGSDSLLDAGLHAGCAGVVSAVANVFPELVVDLYDAHERGATERVRARQRTVFDVRRALKDGPYLSGVKAALALRPAVGFDPGEPRSPLRSMSAGERDRLERRLSDLDLL